MHKLFEHQGSVHRLELFGGCRSDRRSAISNSPTCGVEKDHNRFPSATPTLQTAVPILLQCIMDAVTMTFRTYVAFAVARSAT